jgi:hypothetical protein
LVGGVGVFVVVLPGILVVERGDNGSGDVGHGADIDAFKELGVGDGVGCE